MDTLATLYLREYGGYVGSYLQRLAEGQRVGQAFFNSLSDADQNALQGTRHDPFYGGQDETYQAIEFLLDRKG